jgi:hypothetical protein
MIFNQPAPFIQIFPIFRDQHKGLDVTEILNGFRNLNMAISFEIAQIIEQPIDNVFSFLSNFSNMSSWNYYIQQVTKKSQGNVDVGSIFEMNRPHDLSTFKIIELDPPYKIMVELQPPGPKHQIIFELKGNNIETYITYKWCLDLAKNKALKYFPEGFFKRLILSIPKNLVLTKTKPAVEQNFKKLKELLETGEVRLQDGRHVVLPGK